MWLWVSELQALGFRERSGGYWQCERAYGLPAHAYLSIFFGAASRQRKSRRGPRPRLVDVSAFHVTLVLGVDRIHFYYHEQAEGVWEPGGHTSRAEIGRYAADPGELCRQADQIAARLVT